MNPFLSILLVFISLFVAANGSSSCEQETADLNACIDNAACKTCIAIDGGVAWMSCSELNSHYCASIENCKDSCGSFMMDAYQVWATCYVDSITQAGEDCQQLECGSGRMDETTSSAPIVMTEYIVALLLITFVVSLDG
jgi:hypothetical protein